MTDRLFIPGESVPIDGEYELLNVFGTQTGTREALSAGEEFPAAPLGFSWRHVDD